MAGRTYDAVFNAPADDIFRIAVRMLAQLGFQVTFASLEAGVLSFNTGRSFKTFAGQDLTATIIPLSDDETQVTVGGSLATRGSPFGGGSQLVAWGEKSEVANRFLNAIADHLYADEWDVSDDEPRAGRTGLWTCPECESEFTTLFTTDDICIDCGALLQAK